MSAVRPPEGCPLRLRAGQHCALVPIMRGLGVQTSRPLHPRSHLRAGAFHVRTHEPQAPMIQGSRRHCQQHLSVSTIKCLIFPPSAHPALAQAKGPGISLTPLLSAPSGLWGSFFATDWRLQSLQQTGGSPSTLSTAAWLTATPPHCIPTPVLTQPLPPVYSPHRCVPDLVNTSVTSDCPRPHLSEGASFIHSTSPSLSHTWRPYSYFSDLL